MESAERQSCSPAATILRKIRQRQKEPAVCRGSSLWAMYSYFYSYMFLLLLLSSIENGSSFSAPIIVIRSSSRISSSRRTNQQRHQQQRHQQQGSLFVGHEEGDEMGISVGIDLGTTNSAIAVLSSDGIPTIVSVPHSGRTMPSVVALALNDDQRDHGEPQQPVSWITGRPAQAYPAAQTYRNVKRILGTGGKLSRDIFQTVPHVQSNPNGKTYKKDSLINQVDDAQQHPTMLRHVLLLRENSTSGAGSADSLRLPPELISSHVLRALTEAAEALVGRPVRRAVIGVPAYFHQAQRDATIRAANLAGLAHVKLLREPEAAALAYGSAAAVGGSVGKQQNQSDNDDTNDDELVLVFDLGGGTFDVSMLAIGGGVTEIICTSGNARLGGSVLDAKVAQHCWKMVMNAAQQLQQQHVYSEEAKTSMILAAEAIRIHLSNNRWANVALPRDEETWRTHVAIHPKSVLLPQDHDCSPNDNNANTTHVIFQLTRREMERICQDELQALLRPVREVAIMSGALLPGDASPTMVEAALEMEEEYKITMMMQDQQQFDDFFTDDDDDDSDDNDDNPSQQPQEQSNQQLEMDLMQQTKKSQQRGRQRARNVAKQERKFRQEKRKLETNLNALGSNNNNRNSPRNSANTNNNKNVKVRDGIAGRPISRVVLVGGATRTPAIGRLLAALTGVTPQKTVDPDEAVALGCAVHAGILDGQKGAGTVLNPMQAAILRAVAKQQRLEQRMAQDRSVDEDILDEVESL